MYDLDITYIFIVHRMLESVPDFCLALPPPHAFPPWLFCERCICCGNVDICDDQILINKYGQSKQSVCYRIACGHLKCMMSPRP